MALTTIVGRQLFSVLAVSVDGKSVRLRDRFGIQSDAPRVHDLFGEKIVLEVGNVISCAAGREGEFRDVFVESKAGHDEGHERPEFDGAGPEGPGWTLGEATGDGFVKR